LVQQSAASWGRWVGMGIPEYEAKRYEGKCGMATDLFG
jgi:hypothetical protein